MRTLTDRQSELLQFIESYIAGRGYPPSIIEMTEYMQCASAAGIRKHLAALELSGYIERDPKCARALRVTRGRNA